jgi:hypothetical protein
MVRRQISRNLIWEEWALEGQAYSSKGRLNEFLDWSELILYANLINTDFMSPHGETTFGRLGSLKGIIPFYSS